MRVPRQPSSRAERDACPPGPLPPGEGAGRQPPTPPCRPVVRAFVGLGANLGDRRGAIIAALDALAALPATHLVARSSLFASAPLEADGPEFVNAVAALDTCLTAHELLEALQRIELAHRRTRSHRNAPRTLDLDLLAHGELVLRSPALTLPHPRLHRRAFVLRPLLELAPDLALPGLGRLAAYLGSVSEQPIRRLEPSDAA